jgi:hypothetical protein
MFAVPAATSTAVLGQCWDGTDHRVQMEWQGPQGKKEEAFDVAGLQTPHCCLHMCVRLVLVHACVV